MTPVPPIESAESRVLNCVPVLRRYWTVRKLPLAAIDSLIRISPILESRLLPDTLPRRDSLPSARQSTPGSAVPPLCFPLSAPILVLDFRSIFRIINPLFDVATPTTRVSTDRYRAENRRSHWDIADCVPRSYRAWDHDNITRSTLGADLGVPHIFVSSSAAKPQTACRRNTN
jgi:hypothetical protein